MSRSPTVAQEEEEKVPAAASELNAESENPDIPPQSEPAAPMNQAQPPRAGQVRTERQ